jgi:thiol-disulfide isomerase/thioredoxin
MRHVVVGLVIAAGCAACCMAAADRAVETIVSEYDAIRATAPDASKAKTARALRDARSKYQRGLERRAELALELYRTHPEHERVAKMLAARWGRRLGDPKRALDLQKEIEKVLAQSKSVPVLTEAAFAKASVLVAKAGPNPAAAVRAIDDFISRDPKDERGAMLLCALAPRLDETRQVALLERVLKNYPESSYAKDVNELKKAATGTTSVVQAEGIGKPFVLAFSDAITGNAVSIQRLKGKVVVIDFWATWCGPCVAEMPKMKELYAKYREQGVEFIGVSLDQPKDQGGYERLTDFVASNDVPWPQYYQGDGWKSEFSASWEIRSIPACFLVDTEGRLVATDARGKLNELIPKYLKRVKR